MQNTLHIDFIKNSWLHKDVKNAYCPGWWGGVSPVGHYHPHVGGKLHGPDAGGVLVRAGVHVNCCSFLK